MREPQKRMLLLWSELRGLLQFVLRQEEFPAFGEVFLQGIEIALELRVSGLGILFESFGTHRHFVPQALAQLVDHREEDFLRINILQNVTGLREKDLAKLRIGQKRFGKITPGPPPGISPESTGRGGVRGMAR